MIKVVEGENIETCFFLAITNCFMCRIFFIWEVQRFQAVWGGEGGIRHKVEVENKDGKSIYKSQEVLIGS